MTTLTANEIFRDFNVDGNPASGPFKPVKSELREYFTDKVDNLFIPATETVGAKIVLPEGTDNGAHEVTLKSPDALPGDVTVTLPSTTGTLIGSADTVTLTNKRVTKRRTQEASSATPTINTDNCDIHSITALAANVTSFTTNLSGTPVHGDGLIIEITGTATRALAWGSAFEASTIALPTTTAGTAMLQVGFLYNSATSKWRCVAVA